MRFDGVDLCFDARLGRGREFGERGKASSAAAGVRKRASSR